MPMNWIDQLVGMLFSFVARFISGSIVRWVDCDPEADCQRVFYANHSSHLDIILLWSALSPAVRRRTRPVAARDYWETTPFRRYLVKHIFNAIMIDRAGHGPGKYNPLTVIDTTLKGLGSEYSLIIFPEGTRKTDGTLGCFKGGIYNIAKELPDIELVPVYLENLNRILPKGKFIPVPLLSNVTFGKPTKLADDERKPEFLSRLRECLLKTGEI